MQVSSEKIDKNKVALEIEVEAEKVDDGLNQAYRKVVKKVNIPGFRKGRVPRPILEAKLGKEVLYEDALDILLPKAYQEAVKEQQIEPIDQPKIDVEEFGAGKPLKFKATVEVLPEVKLGTYKGVEAIKPEVKVGDEEVEAQLKMLQERHAQLVDSDSKTVDDGDMVVVDLKATVDGKPEKRISGNNQIIEVGAGKFIPGFEGQLLGIKLGEEKEFTLNLPSVFQYPDLEGKEASFKVKVTAIKQKKLSPLDDEFAKDVSEFATLDELKVNLRNKLEEMGRINAQRIFTERVVNKVVEEAEVELPPVLVKRQVEEETHQFVSRLAYQRLNVNDYLRMANRKLEDLRTDLEHRAEDVVKMNLVLGAVAKAEGLKVSEEELSSEIKDLAAQYGSEPDQLRRNLEEKGQLGRIEDGLLLEKTQKFLADHAVALPEPPEEPKAEAGEAASGIVTEAPKVETAEAETDTTEATAEE